MVIILSVLWSEISSFGNYFNYHILSPYYLSHYLSHSLSFSLSLSLRSSYSLSFCFFFLTICLPRLTLSLSPWPPGFYLFQLFFLLFHCPILFLHQEGGRKSPRLTGQCGQSGRKRFQVARYTRSITPTTKLFSPCTSTKRQMGGGQYLLLASICQLR